MTARQSNKYFHPRTQTAWINAGGRGTRLHGVIAPHATYGVAKALLEVGGKQRVRLIDHQITWLKRSGITNIVVGCGDQIEVADYVHDKYPSDPTVTTIATSQRLGTAGDLLYALNSRPELFSDLILVINVDTVIDLNIDTFIKSHVLDNDITIALTQTPGLKNYQCYGLNMNAQAIYCGELQSDIPRGSPSDSDIALRATSMGALIISTEFMRSASWGAPEAEFSLYTDVIGESFKRRTLGGFDACNAFTLDVGTESTYALSQRSDDNPLDPYLCI
jgi:NDP-sugar pyrophosphorylase family protein